MLHRTSKEIDKNGNVIGGELKEKCDSFIQCLEEFEREYLSDKFNPTTTISGKRQQRLTNSFKKWLDKANRQYSTAKRTSDDFLKRLRLHGDQIQVCYKQAAQMTLPKAKVDAIMELVFAVYHKKCTDIDRINKQITEENRIKKARYEAELKIYKTKMIKYGVAMAEYQRRLRQIAEYERQNPHGYYPPPRRPEPPSEPRLPMYTNPIPFPSGPAAPTRINDELFYKICDIVASKGAVQPLSGMEARANCKKYIVPTLDVANRYCGELIKKNDLGDPEQIRNWFSVNACQESDKDILWYLQRICSFDKNGVPDFDNRVIISDICWTGLDVNYCEVFKETMSKFKSDKSGSSSTKKWIDKVVKSLSKKIKEKTCAKQLEKYLDNLAESLKTEAPMSISSRPTIKQKPVRDKLESLSRYVLDAKKQIPSFPKLI